MPSLSLISSSLCSASPGGQCLQGTWSQKCCHPLCSGAMPYGRATGLPDHFSAKGRCIIRTRTAKPPRAWLPSVAHGTIYGQRGALKAQLPVKPTGRLRKVLVFLAMERPPIPALKGQELHLKCKFKGSAESALTY